MTTTVEGQIKVGMLEEVKARGCTVVTGAGRTIAVFYHQDRVYAVDNRCPHMGFPLEQGTVKDGLLTCHWHHARFDLESGGTFDPFADDVRAFPVSIVDGQVWVNPSPPNRDEIEHWTHRLRDGMEHDIRLVIAKSVLGLNSAGADPAVSLRTGAHFGTTYSSTGWTPAMTMLTCMANILPHLNDEDKPLALYQGLFKVSRDTAGRPPRFDMEPLPTNETRPEAFKAWFREFIDVRDADGAERCLRTAIDLGIPEEAIADMIFAAATDHIYIDGGHTVDFINKAFELVDHIGWDGAGHVLTSLVMGMTSAQRSEELNSWRNPINIAEMTWQAREELPALYEQGQRNGSGWDDEEGLAWQMLEDDPASTLEAIKEAVKAGATPEALGSAVAYAAFLRMARFHTSNEFGDWDTVHNTLTAANALHQALKRAPSVELLRAVFDTAMSIYLDRFLNMPAQRIPQPNGAGADTEAHLGSILDYMNVQQQVEQVAGQISSYVSGNGDPDRLLGVMAHALLREDLDFHAFQIVDACFRQYNLRRGTESGRHVLIGMSRFLAAHCPTPREVGQTYDIALRLQRGEEIFRDN